MTTIDMKPMKTRALGFPEPVKSLILSEPDRMDSSEFITKLGTWDRLLKMSQKPEVAMK
jgi:hypothetical protein